MPTSHREARAGGQLPPRTPARRQPAASIDTTPPPAPSIAACAPAVLDTLARTVRCLEAEARQLFPTPADPTPPPAGAHAPATPAAVRIGCTATVEEQRRYLTSLLRQHHRRIPAAATIAELEDWARELAADDD